MINLDKYIEKCFIDAFASEEREYNRDAWSYEYIIVNNRFVIPVVNCKYGRVLRRAEYRIKNNIERNFGLVIPENRWLINSADSTWLDPNFVFCYVKIGKKTYEIDQTVDMNEEFVPYLEILKTTQRRGITEDTLRSFSFNEYKKLWIQTFGDFHPSLKITDTSSNLVVIE